MTLESAIQSYKQPIKTQHWRGDAAFNDQHITQYSILGMSCHENLPIPCNSAITPFGIGLYHTNQYDPNRHSNLHALLTFAIHHTPQGNDAVCYGIQGRRKSYKPLVPVNWSSALMDAWITMTRLLDCNSVQLIALSDIEGIQWHNPHTIDRTIQRYQSAATNNGLSYNPHKRRWIKSFS